MKPAAAPEVAGNTPWERLDNAVRKVFTVTKDSLREEDAKRKQAKVRKQRKPKQ
jgi:hypothetical protein